MGAVLCAFGLQRVDLVSPRLGPGDLVVAQLLATALFAQLVWLVGLRWGKQHAFLYFVLAWVIAAPYGWLVPEVWNRVADRTETESSPVEVRRTNCYQDPPNIHIQPLISEPDQSRQRVSRVDCRALRVGDVVQLIDGEGRLNGRWRREVRVVEGQGALGFEREGWEALVNQQWSRCAEALTRSLEMEPDGDGGRVYANRGRCLWSLDQPVAALEDVDRACKVGRRSACSDLNRWKAVLRLREAKGTD